MLKGKTITDAAVDPLQFDALLSVFAKPEAFMRTPTDVAQVSELAQDVLPDVTQGSHDDRSFLMLKESVESYPQPCLVLSEHGQIIAINRPAFTAFDLEISDQIDHSGIEAVGTQPLSDQIAALITADTDGTQTSFLRAHYKDAGRPIALAVVPHRSANSATKTALVFFVDMGWDEAIGKFISRAYNLSLAEQEIIEMFILGNSLEQIAESRDRSYKTVRTQFYSALNKCGLSSQVDLVREVVAGSMFQSLVPMVANAARHPHRQELKMLRPGGRTLEVIMSGDFSGTPVFMLSSFGVQKFAPQKTRKFHDAGLCIYAISPPGYGHTSPHPNGTDRITCMAEDVAFLMDQLGLKTVPFVSFGPAFLPTLRLSHRIAERMSGIQSYITVPPSPYLKKADAREAISIVAALGNATLISPSVKNLLTRSTFRAWAVLGSRKFLKIQSQSEPEATPLLLDPETIQAVDEGFKSSVLQGFAQVIQDAEEIHTDWTHDVAACKVPITVIHGCNNRTNSITTLRDFANDFPTTINLIEVEDAGSFLHVTHEDLHVAHLVAHSKDHPPTT